MKKIINLASKYLEELIKWKKAGMPYRSPEKIKELFIICSSNECGQYKKHSGGSGQCLVCGCSLRNNIGFENTEIIEEEINKEPEIKEEVPAPPQPRRGCGCGG